MFRSFGMDFEGWLRFDVGFWSVPLLQSDNLLVDILKLTLLLQEVSSLCGLGNLLVQGYTDV